MSWKRILLLLAAWFLFVTCYPYATMDKVFADGPEPIPLCWPWPACSK